MSNPSPKDDVPKKVFNKYKLIVYETIIKPDIAILAAKVVLL